MYSPRFYQPCRTPWRQLGKGNDSDRIMREQKENKIDNKGKQESTQLKHTGYLLYMGVGIQAIQKSIISDALMLGVGPSDDEVRFRAPNVVDAGWVGIRGSP